MADVVERVRHALDHPNDPIPSARPSVGSGIPQSAGLLRSRLTQRLDRVTAARLGLVIAPAGSGKTALLADWAHARGDGVAWCQATREDTGDSLVRRISLRWGLPVDPEGGIGSVLGLVGCRSDAQILILDDVHMLAQESALRVVQDIVLTMPANTSVLLGSRRMPELDLVHSEISVNPVLLGGDDLRFRSWEVESLFREVYGEPLLPDEAAALARHTSGWAAALHLFHLSTTGQPPSARRRAVDSLAGRNRYASGYLSQQVLTGLGADRSEFLLRTAAFDVLTAARCDALLGRTDSQRTLQDLVDQQTLTTTDDDGATFRYHEVLRRHLEAELEAELGEAGLREWYGRAAELLEAEGALTEALRVRARARDWQGVRALLLRSGREVASREVSWTGLLPTSMLHDDPWIELAQAQRMLADGRLHPAEDATREALQQIDDPRAEDRARELLAVTRAWESLESPPTRRWHEQVAEGLRSLRRFARSARPAGPSQQDALARPFLLLLGGNIPGALEAHGYAATLVDETTPAGSALGLLEGLATLLAGDPRSRQVADAVATQAELNDQGWFTRASRALLAATDADPMRSDEDLRKVRESCDRRGDAWGAAWASMLEGLCGVSRGAGDIDTLDEADQRLRALGAEVPAAWMAALAGLVAGRNGAPDSASRAHDALARAQSVACPGAHASAAAATALVHGDRARLRTARALANADSVTFTPWQDWDLGPTLPSADRQACSVHLTLLGSFAITVDGAALPIAELRPQVRQLLRLLALNAGRPMHREQLAELMWPQQPPSDGTHRLQVAISALRHVVGPEGGAGVTSPLVERDGECYRLRLTPGSRVDVHEFSSALIRARRASDTAAQAAALRDALEWYTGDLLPEDGPADWVVERREQLRAQASVAATSLAELLSEADPRAAVAAAERALRLDGYNDAAWQMLIALHDRLGDRARAKRARDAYAEVLRELGVDAEVGNP